MDNENIDSIRDIVDDLVRLGLVKEVWYVGDAQPRYVAVEMDKKERVRILKEFEDMD